GRVLTFDTKRDMEGESVCQVWLARGLVTFVDLSPNVMSGRLDLAFSLVLEDVCHVWDWGGSRLALGELGCHVWSLACTKLKHDLGDGFV
ncbi:hypothetical protein PIB30_109001, partial [Stylosanthes scabra]|nr:hypothetical protein [Stylosanthes scabra]